MRRGRLHVLGASGAGTTTLARAVADHWSVPHADADDYFWVPTDPPYVEKRPEADRLALMQSVFLPREAWVLSGSMLGWGDSMVALCDAVVFLTLDPDERVRRLTVRETHRLGDRLRMPRPGRRSWTGPAATTTPPSRAGAAWHTRPGSSPSTAPCCGSTARPPARSSATPSWSGSRPRDPPRARQPLTRASQVRGCFSLAAQLTQRWTHSIWGPAARVLAHPPDRAVDLSVGRRLQQAQRRLASVEMDQVVADYQAGMSSNAVGQKYGIDGQTVLNNLKTRGIDARPTSQALVAGDTLDRAVALRQQGWTYTAIGRELGVSRVVVSSALKRADRA